MPRPVGSHQSYGRPLPTPTMQSRNQHEPRCAGKAVGARKQKKKERQLLEPENKKAITAAAAAKSPAHSSLTRTYPMTFFHSHPRGPPNILPKRGRVKRCFVVKCKKKEKKEKTPPQKKNQEQHPLLKKVIIQSRRCTDCWQAHYD